MKPEGVEQTFTQTLFLELALKKNYSDSISFSFPPDVIPGSQRTYVALSGTYNIYISCCASGGFIMVKCMFVIPRLFSYRYIEQLPSFLCLFGLVIEVL